MPSRIYTQILWIFLICGSVRVAAENAGRNCPVKIEQVQLTYNHQGGQSVPRLKVRFSNEAGKRIARVSFSLALLDPDGYPHSYPGDLDYRAGLDAGKMRASFWELRSELVDIHNAGETVVVRRVQFGDGSGWEDGGSESCKLTMDFHAR